MAKYLLANGVLTDSYVDYIIDRFTTRLKLLDTEIPRSDNNGISKTYDGLESDVLVDLLQYDLNAIAAQVSPLIKIKEINYKSDGYNISVSINSQEYELSIRN